MTEITREAVVSLREVTKENLWSIMKLEVHEAQSYLVAPNEMSLAQALFDQAYAWYRAIYADETPVGFLMLWDDPRAPKYFLWRFMIGADYQGMGFGHQAMKLMIAYVKTRPAATRITLSYVPKAGNPGPFYRRLGFLETGEVDHGENVMALELTYGEGEAPAPAIGRPLTHVVLFRLKEGTPENVAAAVDRLRALDGVVPQLRGIEVGANVVESERAYDFALITRFDDLAGMEAYQVHPQHQEVLAYLRTVVASSVAVDYEG